MKLRLIAKTEKLNLYALRFVVPDPEHRYYVTPNGNDRSIEFIFKKDGAFGDSAPESAPADNATWFAGLAIGDDWELKRIPKPAATETP